MIEYTLSDCPFCHLFEPTRKKRETRKNRWDYRKDKPFNVGGFKEISNGTVGLKTTREIPVSFYGTLKKNSIFSGIVLDWDGKVVAHAAFYDNCVLLEEGEWTDAGPADREAYVEETMEA